MEGKVAHGAIGARVPGCPAVGGIKNLVLRLENQGVMTFLNLAPFSLHITFRRWMYFLSGA